MTEHILRVIKEHIPKLLVVGVVIIILASLSVLIPSEPRYEGQSLSYWMAHWYRGNYGGQAVENGAALAAVRQAGTNALPYLIKWVATPKRSSYEVDYASSALKAFKVLGPIAKPAIPELIEALGKKNGNYPAVALAYIGTDSIPALTNALATNMDGRARTQMITALAYMGTNAEPALPSLIMCLNSSNAREQSDAAGTLLTAGRNRPDIVIPILIQALTNSSNHARAAIAESLGGFGGDAKSAIPGLMIVSDDKEPYVRTHVAAALNQISPETPNTLEPLIKNLTHRDVLVREQALWVLEKLGSNGVDALPVLIEQCLTDRVPEVRTIAMRCIAKIGIGTEPVIVALSDNLLHTNSFVSNEAVQTLVQFAPESKLAFLALIKAMRSPDKGVREQTKNNLETISHRDSTFLVECLEYPDPQVRYRALLILHSLEKKISAAVPALLKALNDEDPNIRSAATNTLIQIDWKAAKEAGIPLPWPYNYAR